MPIDWQHFTHFALCGLCIRICNIWNGLEWHNTVYPKKYAHGFCFAVLCCGYTLTGFPISIRLTSLALWQSNDCPSASKATLMNMDKYFTWIHYERLHNHNKAKHNKTVCIFLGIYCTCMTTSWRGHTFCITDPCVRNRSLNSAHKWPAMQSPGAYAVRLKDLLNKQSMFMWFETPWRSCYLTVVELSRYSQTHTKLTRTGRIP